MNKDLPTPKEGAVFYEDKKLYSCLANFPITKGLMPNGSLTPINFLFVIITRENPPCI